MTIFAGWLRDHGMMTLPGTVLCVVGGLWLSGAQLENPFGTQFLDPRLAQFVLLAAAAFSVAGASARTSHGLALVPPLRMSGAWLALLLFLSATLSAAALPDASTLQIAYAIALAWVIPMIASVILSPGAGFLLIAIQLAGLLSSPSRDGGTGWVVFGVKANSVSEWCALAVAATSPLWLALLDRHFRLRARNRWSWRGRSGGLR